MSKQNLEQAQKVLDVFSRNNINPSVIRGWVGSVKNLIINSAVTMPDTGINIIKEDMQLSKEAADFLEDLEAAMED